MIDISIPIEKFCEDPRKCLGGYSETPFYFLRAMAYDFEEKGEARWMSSDNILYQIEQHKERLELEGQVIAEFIQKSCKHSTVLKMIKKNYVECRKNPNDARSIQVRILPRGLNCASCKDKNISFNRDFL